MRVLTTRRSRWALVLTVLLLATSGCLQTGGANPEEVRSDTVEAMESVDTYAFDTETDLEAKAGEEIEEGLSMTHFVRGTASESTERVKTSSNFVVNEETIDQETYSRAPNSNTDELTTYVRLRNTEEESERWFEMDSDVVTSSPVDSHTRLLETSEAEYEGEETVDGETAHVLILDTETERFEEFAVGNAREMMYRVGVFDQGMFDDAVVESGSLRYRISDETDRVLNVESTANLSMTIPDSDEEVEITVESGTEFSSYGGEVETEAPDGIEDAEEFDGVFGGSSASSTERVSEGSGAASYAPDSGVVDVLEVRGLDGDETHTAQVFTNPVEADSIKAEAVESGDSVSVETSDGSREVLELELDPDGDEVVVTVTRDNESEVVYNQTVP